MRPDESLLSVEAARAAILASIAGPVEAETVHLSDALGRVLADDLVASLDLPPWPNSAMDGYALRSSDTANASAAAPVVLDVSGDVAAGRAAAGRVER